MIIFSMQWNNNTACMLLDQVLSFIFEDQFICAQSLHEFSMWAVHLFLSIKLGYFSVWCYAELMILPLGGWNEIGV